MFIRIGAPADHDFDQPLGLLTDCHRRIEHFLGVMLAIAGQARGGRLSDAQRVDLQSALRYFSTAAPRHTADEEESLFPRLRSDDAAAREADAILQRLQSDHADANHHHDAVNELLRHWLDAGELGAEDRDRLDAHLRALDELYRHHIAVEDGQLFPLAERVLSPDQVHEVGREMAARRGVRFPHRQI